MEDIKHLIEILDFIPSEKYRQMVDIDAIEKMPLQLHKRVTPHSPWEECPESKLLNYPPLPYHWRNYPGAGGALNSLINVHLLYPEICDEIIELVDKNLDIKISYENIIIIKCTHDVGKHRDWGRDGVINIYLKNCELGKVQFWDDEENLLCSVQTLNGKAYYLKNTNMLHSVDYEGKTGDRWYFSIMVKGVEKIT